MHNVASRALLLHGSLGVSTEMPFARQVVDSYFLALADGPTEVHKLTLAKQILRAYSPADDMFPTRHGLKEQEKALRKFAAYAEPTHDDV